MKATRRERVKLLIVLSKTVEEADETITQTYGFETVGEKIAFLKGMFDVELISKHDPDGTSNEESIEIDYRVMLDAIIKNYLY